MTIKTITRPLTPEHLALIEGLRHVGVKEATGRNDGEAVERFNLNQPGFAWCAFFVAFCYRTAGHPLPGNRWLQGAVSYLEAECKAAGCWAPPAAMVPRPGCVIFFADRKGSDDGRGRHCALVESVGAHDRLICVEGNFADSVARTTHRRLDDVDITGFAWAPR